MKCLSPNIAQK